MPLQPFGEALGGPVWEKVHDAVQVQVDQNGSILLAFAPSPIVDAEVVNGEYGWLPRRFLPDAAQDCIITCSDRQSSQESLAWKAASHVADEPHDF
jgi:hypothetical protein